MEASLKTANVVIAAKQFNPTIFDQIWLLDNGIATREELQGENAFVLTAPFVQFCAPSFVLVVLPDQLQFTPDPVDEGAGQLVVEKVGRIVTLLPHTPFVAAGLNFVWHLSLDAAAFGEFSKSLFFRENPLYSAFQEDDARYGGYLSKSTLGTRLNLDVRPVRTAAPDGPEAIQFAFNFNLDLPRGQAAVEQITALLRRWDEARNQSASLIQAVREWR